VGDAVRATCTDGPRDDVEPDEGLHVEVRLLGADDRERPPARLVQLAVSRDDDNRHGIVELRMGLDDWRRLNEAVEGEHVG